MRPYLIDRTEIAVARLYAERHIIRRFRPVRPRIVVIVLPVLERVHELIQARAAYARRRKHRTHLIFVEAIERNLAALVFYDGFDQLATACSKWIVVGRESMAQRCV